MRTIEDTLKYINREISDLQELVDEGDEKWFLRQMSLIILRDFILEEE